MVHAIKKPMLGVNSPRQVGMLLASLSIYQLILVEEFGDYLECNTWDGTNQGTQSILIAKPPLIQASYLDGFNDGTYTYASTGVNTMTVTKISDSTTEDWQITLDYVVGDFIYAVGGIRGGIDQVDADGNDLDFIDLNLDGRTWAKV